MRKENGDWAEMSLAKDMNWMESKSLPVSVNDRSIVGSADRGLNSINHIPEVGGTALVSSVPCAHG
jgi:hypothetical protein